MVNGSASAAKPVQTYELPMMRNAWFTADSGVAGGAGGTPHTLEPADVTAAADAGHAVHTSVPPGE
jgi:hypothetical protein